jgi:hypothetical protein
MGNAMDTRPGDDLAVGGRDLRMLEVDQGVLHVMLLP